MSSNAPRQLRASEPAGPLHAPAADVDTGLAQSAGSAMPAWSDSPRQLKQSAQLTQLQAAEASATPAQGGLPQGLRQGIESMSGLDMSGVRVHRNSSKPAALQAHAYAQGQDIHLGPGQEKHLPHEAWHVVQQAQGRVRPTMQMQRGGVAVNDDAGLEAEADVMGARALRAPASVERPGDGQSLGRLSPSGAAPLQARWLINKDGERRDQTEPYELQDGEHWEASEDIHTSSDSSTDRTVSEDMPPLPRDVPILNQLIEQTTASMGSISEDLEKEPPSSRREVFEPISLPRGGEELFSDQPPRLSSDRHADRSSDFRINIESPTEHETDLRVRRPGLDLERGGLEPVQHLESGQRRKRLTAARVFSGFSAPLLEIGLLLGAAISTTLDATGRGPAFLTGMIFTIIAGLRAISEDVKKHEDEPRSWGKRVAHSAGALVPSLMTIPIGLAGTQWGTNSMNVSLAVWLPFTIGVIAILIVHIIKLAKWFSR